MKQTDRLRLALEPAAGEDATGTQCQQAQAGGGFRHGGGDFRGRTDPDRSTGVVVGVRINGKALIIVIITKTRGSDLHPAVVGGSAVIEADSEIGRAIAYLPVSDSIRCCTANRITQTC